MARSGDYLLSVRAPVGALNQACEPTVFGRGLCALRISETDRPFVWHALRLASSKLNRVAQGSTFLAVSRTDVEDLEIPWLEEENQRIASVLDTVDALIDSSEAVLAKLRQVRAGLLHDLLTRGLDADGQLRDPDAHPDQFKDSPLGRIPREWEVKALGDVVQFSSGGTPSRSNAQSWKGNLPFLTPKDMKVFAIGSTIEHLTEDAAIAGSKVMPAETAFIVVRGMILAHTFPVCLSLCRMAFNQDIKGMTGTEGISTRFLAHWLAANEDLFLRKTTEATHGTKKLDLKELEATLIAVPDETEQVQIVKLIEQSDRNLEAEQSELAKLRHLKSGLMTDLLEGRVRVSEDLTCEPARKSTAKGVDLQPR